MGRGWGERTQWTGLGVLGGLSEQQQLWAPDSQAVVGGTLWRLPETERSSQVLREVVGNLLLTPAHPTCLLGFRASASASVLPMNIQD